jgi:hypothetical protein
VSPFDKMVNVSPPLWEAVFQVSGACSEYPREMFNKVQALCDVCPVIKVG